jgi:hypothetical protein
MERWFHPIEQDVFEIALEGTSIRIRRGPPQGPLREFTSTFPTEKEAKNAANTQRREMRSRGYRLGTKDASLPRLGREPDITLDAEDRERIQDELINGLRNGFLAEEEIVASVKNAFVDEPVEHLVERAARKQLPKAVVALAQEARSWPAATDCDRLDLAFEVLEERGIITRHHWSCCQSCGVDAISKLRTDGKRGYVFYDRQDTQAAVRGQGLYLSYGSFDAATPALDIAKEIVAVLRGSRLRTEWNQEPDRRVEVLLDWKRRAPPARWSRDEGPRLH